MSLSDRIALPVSGSNVAGSVRLFRSKMPPPDGKRRRKATSSNKQKWSSTRTPAKRYREPERSITKALTSSGDYTDGESSDSPGTDASFIDNTPEATPQDEGTEEASSPENTTISEATRDTIHMEDLTRQLNFWDRARRKRAAKRNNQRPAQNEEAINHAGNQEGTHLHQNEANVHQRKCYPKKRQQAPRKRYPRRTHNIAALTKRSRQLHLNRYTDQSHRHREETHSHLPNTKHPSLLTPGHSER